MERRASKTAYFFNRLIGYLALIAKDVRFPTSEGVWFPVADVERRPTEVARMLAAVKRPVCPFVNTQPLNQSTTPQTL